jgi:hypothetical protein
MQILWGLAVLAFLFAPLNVLSAETGQGKEYPTWALWATSQANTRPCPLGPL